MTAVRPEQHRPRSKSLLSFGSVRSRKSSGSGTKIDLTETPKDKSSRRMTTKADPSMAINEAQPGKSKAKLPKRAIAYVLDQ